MDLCIDIGNTRTKIAVFDKHQITHFEVCQDLPTCLEWQKKPFYGQIKRVIWSSSGKDASDLGLCFRDLSFVTELTHQTKLPFENRYATPHTLGKDRIAGVAGAWRGVFLQQETAPMLVIDAGTCITFDFIDAQGVYWGGGISPGIQMRFRALHTFTQRLPLLEMNTPILPNFLTGNTTQNAILSGVLNGIVAEIDGIIDQYTGQYSGLKVVMTGGDLPFFEGSLKRPTFAVPLLVLEGLHKILLHNATAS